MTVKAGADAAPDQTGQVPVSSRADCNNCVSKVLDRAENNENITTWTKPFD